MELVLNLGWVVLATVMSWLWVHHPLREGSGRRVQFTALTLVLAMMFTVITLYDDKAMAQNPAETSSFQREDSSGARAHATLHPVANFIQPLFSEPSFEAVCLSVANNRTALALKSRALGSIQNRPPPAV